MISDLYIFYQNSVTAVLLLYYQSSELSGMIRTKYIKTDKLYLFNSSLLAIVGNAIITAILLILIKYGRGSNQTSTSAHFIPLEISSSTQSTPLLTSTNNSGSLLTEPDSRMR